MDPFGMIGGSWWVGIPAAFMLGLALGVSPFAWPVLALATGARGVTSPGDVQADGPRPWSERLNPAVLGMGLAIVLVYAGLGFATDRLDAVLRVGIGSVAGIVYAVIAVAAVGGGIALLARPAMLCHVPEQPRRVLARGPVSGFLVGLPLALANCPSCAIVITGVALAAGASGSTAYAVGAMTALGVGHAAALVLGSMALLRPFEQGFRVGGAVRRIGAVVLLGVGVWYAVQASRYGLEIAPPLY